MATFKTPGIAIALAENESVGEKVQLFRVGTFHHADYGKFEITPDMLKKMAENFSTKVRGVDLAIDYKHDSDDVAAGWIKEVHLSEDGNALWATVEWTPKGKKVLSDKEFRYVSPEFSGDYQDNESLKKFGPTLLGAGLTNRPVIKRMEPVIELAEMKPEESKPCDEKKGIDSAEPAQPQPQQKTKEKKGVVMDYKAMEPAELEKLSPEELKAMVMELMAKMKEMEAAKGAMGEKVAAMEQEKALSEKKDAFAKLLSEGKACKAQEEAYLANDMIKFAELASSVKLNEKGTAQTAQPMTSEDAYSEVKKLAGAKVADKSAKTLGEAISKVLHERKDLKEKVYA